MSIASDREEALAVLNEMTKAEIIAWLGQDIGFLFRPPRRSHLLFARYKATSDAAMARSAKNKLRDGLAKDMDRLRGELGKAKDHKEFLAIAKKLEPYEKEFQAWLDECNSIRKAEAKADAMYDEYDKQQAKESGRLRVPPKGGDHV